MTQNVQKYPNFLTDRFIQKAKLKHGDKYDYSNVIFIATHKKVDIICNKHGVFSQTPSNHLSGKGCPKCAGKNRTTKEFIECKIQHDDIFDYSQTIYNGINNKINIICKKHGLFTQTANSHVRGTGCPICSGNKHSNTNDFVEKSIKIHGKKYDYSLVDYKNSHTNVTIICAIHGEFLQTPANHLHGAGCHICGGSKKSNTEEFIKKSQKIHGNKYDYSLVVYKNWKTKIIIICSIHGEFEQTPNKHLFGQGCYKCNQSHGERDIANILDSLSIKYLRQKTFEDCRNIKKLPFDFYLPDLNICIEYDGLQHTKSIERWGGDEGLESRIKNDTIKTKYCNDNKIKLIRLKDKEYQSLNDILKKTIE